MQKNYTKKIFMTQITMSCDQSPRARHPGMWSQVGLRKPHYEQSQWRWWNSSWAIPNPKRWCHENTALSMPANLANSAVATGLKKSVFVPIPKKGNAKECSNYHTIALIFSSVQSLSRVWLFATPKSQHSRPPHPSPSPGVHSNSHPSS